MQISDNIHLGPVFLPALPNPNAPSPQELGVGPMARLYVFDAVPVALNTTGIAAAQTTAAAGNLTLTAGTGATSVTRADGQIVVQLDYARCVTLTVATTDQSAVSITVYGYDHYGQAMTQTLNGPNANTVSTTKAFKQISRVAASAALLTNGVSVGFNDKLGLPYKVANAVYVQSVKWASTLAADAGTFVAAVTTDPATATTGDVRGTYQPSSVADGAKRLIMSLYLDANASGPQASRPGAGGVAQV